MTFVEMVDDAETKILAQNNNMNIQLKNLADLTFFHLKIYPNIYLYL